jgi:hypothetical protein
MYFEDGAILRDQNGASPGRYGDSCFDTFAFGLSHFWTSPGHEYHPRIDHKAFITATGTLRNKHSIWRQNDMTEDNEKPLLMFLKETGNSEDWQFVADRCWDDLKTGNMHLISPGYVAELTGWQWLRCFTQTMQVLFFWFPWYWNDGKWKKGEWPIGNAWKKTDGYLQWALTAHLTPWPFRRLISKATLKRKIREYYNPEIDAIGELSTTIEVIATHRRMVDLL